MRHLPTALCFSVALIAAPSWAVDITITNISAYRGNFQAPDGDVVITGDSDVSTEGTLVAAANYGSVFGGTTTVNGVDFENLTSFDFEGPIVTTGGAIRLAGNIQQTVTTSAATGAFAGLSTEYQTLLGEGVRRDSFTTSSFLVFESFALNTGSRYQFQLWSNDSSQTFSRSFDGGPRVFEYSGNGDTNGDILNRNTFNASSEGDNLIVNGGDGLPLDPTQGTFQIGLNNDFANIGGLGSYLVGEFVFDGGSDIVLTTRSVLNAVQLRELPPVIEGPTGDYNDDGTVDAADYTVWRDNLGQDGSVLLNRDPMNSGVVGGADYSSWRANYGADSAGSAFAVPEPAAIGLTWILLAGCVPLRGQKRASAP